MISWLQAIHWRLRDLQYNSDHREERQSIQCADLIESGLGSLCFLNVFLWLTRIILSGFPDDPRSGLAEALFGLLLTPFCLFVGRLIRGCFLGSFGVFFFGMNR